MSELSVARFGGPKSGKFRKMLSAFVDGNCSDLTEACKVAGYGFPSKAAAQIRKRWAQVIDAVVLEWRDGLKMSAEEATEGMAAIARNKKHKDQYNALKTILTMHGKLDTTVNVSLTRSELNKALDELIAQLAESRQAIVSELSGPQAADPTTN
jgi:DNA-binding TFAR19-related protein (PDSD5 family)